VEGPARAAGTPGAGTDETELDLDIMRDEALGTGDLVITVFSDERDLAACW
jgi:hypothetical protein